MCWRIGQSLVNQSTAERKALAFSRRGASQETSASAILGRMSSTDVCLDVCRAVVRFTLGIPGFQGSLPLAP